MKFSRTFSLALALVLSSLLLLISIINNISSAHASQAKPEAPLIIYSVPESFDSLSESYWMKFSELIHTTTARQIIVYWEGFGGDLYISERVERAFDDARRAGKHITIIPMSYVASAHAYTACHASEIVLRPGAMLLFHHGFLGNHNYKLPYGLSQLQDYELSVCREQNILTDADVDAIKHFHTVYIFVDKNRVIHHVIKNNDDTQ